jgi:hypothetical protein
MNYFREPASRGLVLFWVVATMSGWVGGTIIGDELNDRERSSKAYERSISHTCEGDTHVFTYQLKDGSIEKARFTNAPRCQKDN